MSSIGKTALAARLAARLGVTHRQAEQMIEETLLEITRALEHGEGVTLQGFGAWRLVHAAAREGTAPDGSAYSAPAHTAVKFRPADALVGAVRSVLPG